MHAILCYRFANRGYLDVAITKIKLSVKFAKNGRENIWSVKGGVHLENGTSFSNKNSIVFFGHTVMIVVATNQQY